MKQDGKKKPQKYSSSRFYIRIYYIFYTLKFQMPEEYIDLHTSTDNDN